VEVEYTGRTVIANRFTFRKVMDDEPANDYYSPSDIVLPQLAYGLVDTRRSFRRFTKTGVATRFCCASGLRQGKLYS